MSHHDELPSIDPSTLEDVTGGVTSTASSGTDTQLTAALQGITSQLSSLGKTNNSSGSSLQSLLPMMLLLGKGGAGGGGGGGGACPCGCGMASCTRR